MTRPVAAHHPRVVVRRRQDPEAVERILRGLPEWFGVESALRGYVDAASALPTCLAVADERTVGVLLIRHHFDVSAEIHLLAVDRDCHRQGIGRKLLDAAEADLAARRRPVPPGQDPRSVSGK